MTNVSEANDKTRRVNANTTKIWSHYSMQQYIFIAIGHTVSDNIQRKS